MNAGLGMPMFWKARDLIAFYKQFLGYRFLETRIMQTKAKILIEDEVVVENWDY